MNSPALTMLRRLLKGEPDVGQDLGLGVEPPDRLVVAVALHEGLSVEPGRLVAPVPVGQ
jgi:hypothetical protein